MSFIKEYFELTKNHIKDYGKNTILLTQNGAFFEVYGLKDINDNIHSSNLFDFSRICDLNIVGRKVPGGDMLIDGERVVNAGFKTHLIEKYIKKMQESGFTVIVYEETGEDPIKRQKIRSITGIYSPGTFFNQDIENEQLTNNICCLWIETSKGIIRNNNKTMIYIGAGLVDIFTGYSVINEYHEEYIKNPITFDELERFIAIYKPSETIIITNLNTIDINDIVSFIDLKSKSLHVVSLLDDKTNKNVINAFNCEKQTYQYELLNKFYKIFDIQSFMTIFYENVYATQAFCFLLDFIYQHNPYLINNIAEPLIENTNKRMILANHSLKQLNIIDDDNYKGKYSSVSKMLNECITSMGKRKFTHNFLNPTTDEEYLQSEYDITEHILTNDFIINYSNIKNMLVQIKDISKIMRQIIIQKVTPKSLFQLYNSISISNRIYQNIIDDSVFISYLTNKLPNFVSLFNNSNEIMNYLNNVFILSECQDIDNISKIEKSFIQNGVDPELDNKIKTLMDSQDKLNACCSYFNSAISITENKPKKSKAKSKTKAKTKPKKVNDEDDEENDNEIDDDDENELKSYVSIHETEKNNYSILTTDIRSKILQDNIKNINQVKLTYNSSYSNAQTEFILSLNLEYVKQSKSKKQITNEQIEELCKNITQIKFNLIDTVNNVYQTIIKQLQKFNNHVEDIINFITYIDLIYAKAYIADKYNYCKPEIDTNKESNKSFVSVNELRHCLIEKIQQSELYIANDLNIGYQQDGILLYGTNAVGKTSFIRALGISVIMAQSGLYVPATNYRYKPYKHLFTRILGNDNIFKGLSTFAVEMSELRTILRLADENSLVLGDELCSGTESISAVSIFVAGVQNLSKLGCSFIFATHLHEIIHYDEIVSLSNVVMKHMSVKYDVENDCLVYDRKLKDGPGNSMYGLEVCKSLHLPKDFLDLAHSIRVKYHPETAGILQQKQSHFNSSHLSRGLCEKCNKLPAVDVHHLVFQNEANQKGVIKTNNMTFQKNNKANLLNLCENCHSEIHKTNKKYKKTKTTKGVILEELI
jgi:DNA mismatch repair protein MutS